MSIELLSIELLWIIPIISAAFVIFTIVINWQKRFENESDPFNSRDLKKEVDEFNSGMVVNVKEPAASAEKRLSKIESTIQLVSTALSNQQKVIENFQGKDDTLENELNDLKEKLKELQKEYDITISENYSLRAHLNKIERERSRSASGASGTSSKGNFTRDIDAVEVSKVLNMKVYEEDRKLNLSKPSALDDTSEINLSKYNS